jgi:ATP-dependent RNA helicase RhlE
LLDESIGPVLVFVRTKRMAAQLTKMLHKTYPVAEIHSDRSQYQRQQAIAGFRSGKYRILIATDIAARGIDVKDIQLVINYDIPDEAESYIHRIGRTGRAGQNGKAVSIATPDQGRLVRDIERLLKKSINIIKPADGEILKFSGAERPARTRRTPRGEQRGKKGYGFSKLAGYEQPPKKEKHSPAARANRSSNKAPSSKPLYSHDSSDSGNYFQKKWLSDRFHGKSR